MKLTSLNKFIPNGFIPNGFVLNGFVANGLVANGFASNRFFPDGFVSNKGLALSIFALIFLTPHLMGHRFSGGFVDLPRVAMVITMIVGAGLYFKEWIALRRIALPAGALPIVIFAGLIMASGLFSPNMITSSDLITSLAVALKLVGLWIIFPLACFKVLESDIDGEAMNTAFMVLFSVLMGWVVIEVIRQDYLVPLHLRNALFDQNFIRYEELVTRRYFRDGALLPIGPFVLNHVLSGFACIGLGVALWAMERFKTYGLIFAYGIFMLVAVAGARAGMVGAVVALIAYALWFRNPMVLIHFIAAILCVEMVYLAYLGVGLPPFYVSDINQEWIGIVDVNVSAINQLESKLVALLSNPALAFSIAEFFRDLGTVGIRIAGFLVNLTQWQEWWPFGYGLGIYPVRPSILSESYIIYKEPGLIQLIMLQSGLVAGFLLIGILIRGVLIGLKYEAMKYYSVAIFAWSLLALSSPHLWSMIFVILFVLRIHHYHRQASSGYEA